MRSLMLIHWDLTLSSYGLLQRDTSATYRGKIKVGMMEYLGDMVVEIIDFFELVKSSKSSSKVYGITVI